MNNEIFQICLSKREHLTDEMQKNVIKKFFYLNHPGLKKLLTEVDSSKLINYLKIGNNFHRNKAYC